MPLVDRMNSVLTVVDTQPGFFAHSEMTGEERAAATGAVDRIAWLVGLASLIDVPAVVVEEGADRNGTTDPRVLERLGADPAVHAKDTFSLTGCTSSGCERSSSRTPRTRPASSTSAAFARMTDAGVERNHFKGLVFEWLRTIDYAREKFELAIERFGPFPAQ